MKSIRIRLISILTALILLIGIAPIPSLAVSIPPEETPAETVYVGGVELQMDQYVMNGSSTAVDGTPADDADGFAWYSESGLLLVNYVYEGQGHLYDGDNYAVISSTGYLEIGLFGTNKLTQTEEYGTGIYAGGDLVINGFGPMAECLEVTASFALYADYSLFIGSNAKKIKINSDNRAMTADDLIVFGGGDVDITTYFPISLMSEDDTAEIVIVNGSVEVKSNSGAFAIPPYLDDYNDAGREVKFILSENSDGSDPLAAGSAVDLVNFSKYKYFYFGEEEVEPEYIESISVSGADLPEVGETRDDMEFTPDTLTYGGEYKAVGRSFEKYTGAEWVECDEALEYGVKYRVSLVLAPSEGYVFADSITSDDVTFNGESGIFETLISGVGYAVICYEFSYPATATDYGITIADKDESGATVGVLITEENYTDVLGDGTVSYDPATKTLTLNGYKYEGDGFFHEGANFGIRVSESIGTLNIVLKGENIIDLTKEDTLARRRIISIGAYTWETDVVFSGDGSLVISATEGGLYIFGEDDPSLEIKGGNITVNACYSIDAKYFKMSGGSLTVNATEGDGDIASAIYSYEFKMTGGNLKITSAGLGVEMWHDSDEDAPPMINGGSFEISAATAGGAFCYYDYDSGVSVAIAPDLTNYVGAHKLTAGVNADGTGASGRSRRAKPPRYYRNPPSGREKKFSLSPQTPHTFSRKAEYFGKTVI